MLTKCYNETSYNSTGTPKTSLALIYLSERGLIKSLTYYLLTEQANQLSIHGLKNYYINEITGFWGTRKSLLLHSERSLKSIGWHGGWPPDSKKWAKKHGGSGKVKEKGVKMTKNWFSDLGSKIWNFWGLGPQISDPCQPMLKKGL